MINFKERISLNIMFMLAILYSANLLADSQSPSHSEDQTSLKILFPKTQDVKVRKVVFSLEAYRSLECPLNNNLNKDHPDYMGRLIHQEAARFSKAEKILHIEGDQPLTLSALFSQISDDGSSEICYYQSQSFWPRPATTYQIEFTRSCQVMGFRLLPDKTKTSIKLNNLLDSCFAKNSPDD